MDSFTFCHDSIIDSAKDFAKGFQEEESIFMDSIVPSALEPVEFNGLDDLLGPPTHPFNFEEMGLKSDLGLKLENQLDNFPSVGLESGADGFVVSRSKDGKLKRRRRSSLMFANLTKLYPTKPSTPTKYRRKSEMAKQPLKTTGKARGDSNLTFPLPQHLAQTKSSQAQYPGPKDAEPNYRKLAMTETYMQTNADGTQTLLCPFPGCSCKFKFSSGLVKHMDEHYPGNRRHFKCNMCRKIFYSAGCLKSHKISHFKNTSKYVCKVPSCGKQYSTAEGLRLHIRNHHQVNKKWKCMADGCVRSFVRQADLRMHIVRVHTVDRPFPCTTKGCGKAFACHSELRRHAATFHNVSIPPMSNNGNQYAQPELVASLIDKAVVYQKTMGLK